MFIYTKSQQRRIKKQISLTSEKEEKKRKKNIHRRNRKKTKKDSFKVSVCRSKIDKKEAKNEFFNAIRKDNEKRLKKEKQSKNKIG